MSILNPLVQKLFDLPGISAILAVNIDTGEPLFSTGGLCDEKINRISMANAKIIRLRMSMVADQFNQELSDIIVSLNNEYHLIYLLPAFQNSPRNFLYIILQKDTANLAYSRHKINLLLESLLQHDDEVRLLEIETDYLIDKDNIRTKIGYTETGRIASTDEDVPAYLRTEVALQLLGVEAADIENAAKFPLGIGDGYKL